MSRASKLHLWLLLVIPFQVDAQLLLPLLQNIEVYGVIEDGNKVIWFATQRGLYYSRDGYTVREAGGDRQRLTSIAFSDSGIMVGGDGGVFRVSIDDLMYDRAELKPVSSAVHPDRMIRGGSGGVIFVTSNPDEPSSIYKSIAYYKGFIKEFEGRYIVLGVDSQKRLWVADKRQLFHFNSQDARFEPVEGSPGNVTRMVDVGTELYFLGEGNTGNEIAISPSRTADKIWIHLWRSESFVKSYSTYGEIFGQGSIRGRLWLSILGELYLLDDSKKLFDIDLGVNSSYYTRGDPVVVREIEETENYVLLVADNGVLVQEHDGEGDFTFVTHVQRHFTDVIQLENGVILWGESGAFRFGDDISIDVELNGIARVGGFEFILSDSVVLDASYANSKGNDPVPRVFPRSFRFSVATSREDFETQKDVTNEEIYLHGSVYRPEREHESLFISILDGFGNRRHFEDRQILLLTGISGLVVKGAVFLVFMPLILSGVILLPWRRIPWISLWILRFRCFLYFLLFLNLSLVPSIFRKLLLLAFPLMRKVLRDIYVDRLHERYCKERGHLRCINCLERLACRDLVYLSEMGRGASLEVVLHEVAACRDPKFDIAFPVICHLENLPKIEHPGVADMIQRSVLDALNMELWFLGEGFCGEILLLGQFIFFCYCDSNRDSPSISAMRFFLENSGENFIVLCSREK